MKNENLFFLFGEESFLVEEEVNALESKYQNFEKNIIPSKYSFDELFSAISTGSLFLTPKLILLKNPWFLFEAINDNEYKKFENILQAIKANTENRIIIYAIGKKVDQRKKTVKAVKGNALCKEFVSFKDWEQSNVLSWLEKRISAQNKTITQEALFILEQIGGTNLRQLALELEKLVVYLGNRDQITAKDVLVISSANAQASIFHLNEAFKQRQIKKILSIINIMLKNGEDPIRLLALLSSNLRFY